MCVCGFLLPQHSCISGNTSCILLILFYIFTCMCTILSTPSLLSSSRILRLTSSASCSLIKQLLTLLEKLPVRQSHERYCSFPSLLPPSFTCFSSVLSPGRNIEGEEIFTCATQHHCPGAPPCDSLPSLLPCLPLPPSPTSLGCHCGKPWGPHS